MENITRRDFMIKTAAASAALAMTNSSTVKAEPVKVKVGVFSKHLQWLNYYETADAVADIGWEGIECPIRPKGQILPKDVEEDLPIMMQALKSRDLEMMMVTTAFKDVNDPEAQTLLRTIADQKIKLYRTGGWKYDIKKSIPEQLIKVKTQLTAMSEMNARLGICAAYQNHSGTSNVGAPLWDLYKMIKDMDPDHMGVAFDIGHATVEGGYVWPVNAKLMRPSTKIVIVKDFKWGKDRGRWRAQWCPLGDGMVNMDFFKMLKETGYNGSVIQHFEWEIEGRTEKQIQKNTIKAMKKDCRTLKSILSDVGLR